MKIPKPIMNILAYNFPPVGLSGSLRNLFYAQYFSKKWEVKVFIPTRISKLYRIDQSLVKKIPKSVKITKIKTTAKSDIFNTIYALFYTFSYPWPDLSWLKKISQNKKIIDCDVLIVSTPPYSSLAGIAKLIIKHKPKQLIIDFRDPWTSLHIRKKSILLKILSFWWRKIEKKIIKKADLILVTSEIHKGWLIKDFPRIDKNKIQVIYNGIINTARKKIKKKLSKKVIYAGSFSTSQNLEIILYLVKKLPEYYFYFVGEHPKHFKNKIKQFQNIKLVKYLTREKLMKLQSEMDFGIASLPNEFDYAIPAKIFEYLEANIPIIGILPPAGAAYSLIKKEKIGLVSAPENINSLIDDLTNLNQDQYNKLLKNAMGVKEKYSREEQAKKLEKLIAKNL